MKKLLIILVLLFCVSFLYLLFPVSDPPNMVKFIILSQVIFLLYLGIYFIGRKMNISFKKDKNLWMFLLACAVILRFTIPIYSIDQTYLSDDVYRYVWEGKMVLHAYNPYIYSPNDFRNSGLADDLIYPLINHPWHVTIYPPLSQYLFAMTYLISGDSIIGFKLLSLLFEFLSLFLMFILVRKFDLPDWTYLLYLFCPLILIEFLFSNHLDIFGLPIVILLLLNLKESKPNSFLIGILAALGVVVKLYLLFFIPFLIFYFKGKYRLYFIISFLIIVFISYLPFIASSGFNVFGSLVPYLSSWQYNGSIFLLFKQVFGQTTARYICYSIFLSAYIPLFFVKPFKNNLYLQMFAIFGLYLILTPSIFNWYMLWIIPFIILFRNYSFLILSGTIFLSYHVLIGYYNNGVWSDYPILRILTYGPFYLILSVELYYLFKKKIKVIL